MGRGEGDRVKCQKVEVKHTHSRSLDLVSYTTPNWGILLHSNSCFIVSGIRIFYYVLYFKTGCFASYYDVNDMRLLSALSAGMRALINPKNSAKNWPLAMQIQ